jgi:hypothetical protein
MEAAFKYGKLLKKQRRKTVDAEVVLVSPFLITVCPADYNLLSLSFSPEKSILLTSITLVRTLIGVATLPRDYDGLSYEAPKAREHSLNTPHLPISVHADGNRRLSFASNFLSKA